MDRRVGGNYRLGFDADRRVGRTDLVFDGIDGFATITLNDNTRPGGEPAPDLPLRCIRSARASGNELVVAFDAPDRTQQPCDHVGDLPNPYGTPYNFVRKMACNFGGTGARS